MNRIQRGTTVPPASPLALPSPVGSRFESPQPAVAPEYALFRPMHYEPNYAYPLVVYLHGPRGSQRQLNDFMPALSVRNYAAIAPQGVKKHALSGYCWGDSPSDYEISSAYDRVMACVDVAQEKLNIHPDRVFLAGYADGGSMALRVALKAPALFAGAVSLCGAFPSGNAPLAQLRDARKFPLLIAAGRDGQNYTVEQSCEELRLFHTAGMSVSLRQYPGGDELDTQMLRDMNAWMMELITGSPASLESDVPIEPWSEESN